MTASPFLGVLFHAIGGLAAGSFYIPYKKVRNWSWETYWLVGGIFSWLIAPWVFAFILVHEPIETIMSADVTKVLLPTYGFGVLWGIGGLTFGLSMRYLGLSLGYAVALGFCAAFGTIIPPVVKGEAVDLVTTVPGAMTLLGVIVCLVGIGICGKAGMMKEREVTTAEAQATIAEFSLVKGLWVAVFAGIMSACMSYGFAAGAPIGKAAAESGTMDQLRNVAMLPVVLLGGLTTNLIWCLILSTANHSGKDYVNAKSAPLPMNYLFCAAAGVMWYLQFFFYGIGTTWMGKLNYTSWTIHMAFIIIFSTLWGLQFREWKGTSARTRRMLSAGLATLIFSILIIGLGAKLVAPS